MDTVAPVITRTFSNQQYFGVEFVENIDCSDMQVEVTNATTLWSNRDGDEPSRRRHDTPVRNSLLQHEPGNVFDQICRRRCRSIRDHRARNQRRRWNFSRTRQRMVRQVPETRSEPRRLGETVSSPTRASDAPSSFDASPFDHLSEPAAVPTGVRLAAVLGAAGASLSSVSGRASPPRADGCPRSIQPPSADETTKPKRTNAPSLHRASRVVRRHHLEST